MIRKPNYDKIAFVCMALLIFILIGDFAIDDVLAYVEKNMDFPGHVYVDNVPEIFQSDEHIVYIDGCDDGCFNPDGYLTRSQASYIVYKLLNDTTLGQEKHDFNDVVRGERYYYAITVVTSKGLIQGYKSGNFYPDCYITRKEFISLFANCTDRVIAENPFSDVKSGDWATANLITAEAMHWISADENGCIRPNDKITRAEAVAITNAVLGRSASSETSRTLLDEKRVKPFADVDPSDEYYADICEASMQHTSDINRGEDWTSLTYRDSGYDEGFITIKGSLYYVTENGQFYYGSSGAVTLEGQEYFLKEDGSFAAGEIIKTEDKYYAIDKNGLAYTTPGTVYLNGDLYCVTTDGSLGFDMDCGVLHFGADGKYTSGNEELDAYVKQLVDQCVTDDMTNDEMLKACYDWFVSPNTKYLSDKHYKWGENGWEEERALFMFEHHKSNCYGYAAAFMYMARSLGYQATCVSGGWGPDAGDHAWTMIDGLMCDPELEFAYVYRVKNKHHYNLYMMDPDRASYIAPGMYYWPKSK